MILTVKEDVICSKYMNVGGKNRCKECPLYFGQGECYATIDGRGMGIERFAGPVDGVVQGVKEIAAYAEVTVYQVVYHRDELGLPLCSTGKALYAYTDELDKWKEAR